MGNCTADQKKITDLDDLPADDPLIQFSVISRASDTQPRPRHLVWSTLTSLFTNPSIRESKDGTAWIPATFGGIRSDKGGLRHNKNVLSIHGIMLDLDGKVQTYTPDELRARLSGFQYLAHTTYSHTPEKPRWRVFLPTATPLSPDELKSAILKAAAHFNLSIDTSCTDPARLYYMPACPRERAGQYRCIHDKGQLLDPASLPGTFSLDDEDGEGKASRMVSHEPSNKYLILGSYVDDVSYSITKQKITEWGKNSQICAAVASAMGLHVDGLLETGRVSGIKSPLPGHTDNNPSGGLIISKGTVLFKDFSAHFGREIYTLPTLAATVAYGELHMMNGPENTLWWLRLLHEAGLIRLADVDIPSLPDDASEGVHKVYDGFKLVLGLKWRYKGGQRSTAFAKRFVAAWCGVSVSTAERAKLYLMDHGIISMIRPHKGRRECGVFLPGKIRKSKPQKTPPEATRSDFSHEKEKQTRLHISLSADRLMADYEGMPLRPVDIITALAGYTGIPEIALKRHYSDLVRSIVRDFKKGRR